MFHADVEKRMDDDESFEQYYIHIEGIAVAWEL